MITKILPKIVNKPNKYIRNNIQRTTSIGCAILAGSSMSGWNSPLFEPTEMIIPGGLTFKEKFYYTIKGRLPKSVYERWINSSENYIPKPDDQIVVINKDGNCIGSIIEPPHAVGSTPTSSNYASCNQDISDNISDTISENFDDIDDIDDIDISTF